LGYPNNPTTEVKEDYKTFFTSIGKILPCSICSNHYQENLLVHPITDDILSSRDNLLKWTIDMHNEVNKQNNKKIFEYDEGIQLIRNNFNDNQNTTPINNQNTTLHNNQNTIPINNRNTMPINTERFELYDKSSNNQDIPEKSNNTMLYLLMVLFIALIIIAVLYKKN
jgi:uncharacterized membrane protein